jgi:hypothetical protein
VHLREGDAHCGQEDNAKPPSRAAAQDTRAATPQAHSPIEERRAAASSKTSTMSTRSSRPRTSASRSSEGTAGSPRMLSAAGVTGMIR